MLTNSATDFPQKSHFNTNDHSLRGCKTHDYSKYFYNEWHDWIHIRHLEIIYDAGTSANSICNNVIRNILYMSSLKLQTNINIKSLFEIKI